MFKFNFYKIVSEEDTMNDLKLTLGNLWYALDDEWTGDSDPYNSSFIQPIAEKYGWSKEDILDAVGPIC